MASLHIPVYCVSVTSRLDVLSFTKGKKGALSCPAELVSPLQIGAGCRLSFQPPSSLLHVKEHPKTSCELEAVPSF